LPSATQRALQTGQADCAAPEGAETSGIASIRQLVTVVWCSCAFSSCHKQVCAPFDVTWTKSGGRVPSGEPPARAGQAAAVDEMVVPSPADRTRPTPGRADVSCRRCRAGARTAKTMHLVRNVRPAAERAHHSASISGLRIFLTIADDLKRLPCRLRCQGQRGDGGY